MSGNLLPPKKSRLMSVLSQIITPSKAFCSSCSLSCRASTRAVLADKPALLPVA